MSRPKGSRNKPKGDLTGNFYVSIGELAALFEPDVKIQVSRELGMVVKELTRINNKTNLKVIINKEEVFPKRELVENIDYEIERV